MIDKLSHPKDTLVNFLGVKLIGNEFTSQNVIRIINAVKHLQQKSYFEGASDTVSMEEITKYHNINNIL